MTSERSWLDQLPADAPERQLLLAGLAARPDEATIDRSWRAFTLAVGAATATTAATGAAAASAITTAVSGSATTAAMGSATTATGTAAIATAASGSATTAVGTAAASAIATAVSGSVTVTLGASSGLMGLLATKAIALGFVAGIGVLGIGEVARRVVSEPSVRTVAAVTPSAVAAVARSQTSAIGSLNSPPRASDAVAPALQTSTVVGAVSSPTARPPIPKTRLGSTTTQKSPNVPAGDVAQKSDEANAPTAPPTSHHIEIGSVASATTIRRAPLVEQARELAATKRLIDAGSVGEALRRLQASYLSDYDSALAEEREALYIDVLARAGRSAEAQRRAERFLSKYPASPYQTKMRALVVAQ